MLITRYLPGPTGSSFLELRPQLLGPTLRISPSRLLRPGQILRCPPRATRLSRARHSMRTMPKGLDWVLLSYSQRWRSGWSNNSAIILRIYKERELIPSAPRRGGIHSSTDYWFNRGQNRGNRVLHKRDRYLARFMRR